MEDGRQGEQLGAWRLDKLIGSGGMGDVYLAHRTDGVVRQLAAVKVLRSVRQGEFADEADTIRPLRHPNIAGYLGDGVTADGFRYLVIEYVEGRPITDYADQGGLSVRERLALFVHACDAIAYAHQHLVVHMDLKPSNILVNMDGRVKVIDFGIARRLDDQHVAGPATGFSGPYACPEQIQRDHKLGYPVDTYGLGAVLYELLCGHSPFNSRLSAGELERQIMEESPRPPSSAINQAKLTTSDSGRTFRLEPEENAKMRAGQISEIRKTISGNLDRICLFALRKEAHRRYKSADDFRSDIESVLAGRTPAIARSGDPLYSTIRKARRKPLVVFAVVMIISGTYSEFVVSNSWSTGTVASRGVQRQLDSVADSGIRELTFKLRPTLASDPQFRSAVGVLDTVVRNAAPVPPPRTFWERVGRDGDGTLRRLWEIIRGK
ncbi:MAG: serine/threonine-protein kinase [Ignavibacteriota bacterium]